MTTATRQLARIDATITQAVANIVSARALAETMTDDEREAFAANLAAAGLMIRSRAVRGEVDR